jgi:hypothetical protein
MWEVRCTRSPLCQTLQLFETLPICHVLLVAAQRTNHAQLVCTLLHSPRQLATAVVVVLCGVDCSRNLASPPIALPWRTACSSVQHPHELREDCYMLQLPPPRFRLPREKKIPEAKSQTKWEKFAESKGIQKRKRSRMVFDEDKDEYVMALSILLNGARVCLPV